MNTYQIEPKEQPELFDFCIEKRTGIQVLTEWIPCCTREQIEHLLKVRGYEWVKIASIKVK